MFRNLETKRLILKNIGYEDGDFMAKQFSTKEVNAYLFDAEPISSIEEANVWIKLYTQEEPRNQHRWILILKENNEKIGTCGFHCWDKENGTVEVGYDLQPKYWKQGYMSEALSEIIDFAKTEMQIKKIESHIAEGNIASIKTSEKFGFKKQDKIYFEDFHNKKYKHFIYAVNLK